MPHYIYGRSRLDVRLVRDWTAHKSVHHIDGVTVGSSFDHQQRRYAPHWYADSFPLLAKHAVPLSSDEGGRTLTLTLTLTLALALTLILTLTLTSHLSP